MRCYAVYPDMRVRRCGVIGGGSITEGKVKSLLKAGARATVVSSQLTPALKHLADEGRVAHIPRGYQRGDLGGAFLAISATGDWAVNKQV